MLSHFLRAANKSFTLSLVGSQGGITSTSGGITVTYPTGIAAGDLIVVLFDAGDSTSATPPTINTPSGYTFMFTQSAYNTANADADTMSFYYKIATGSETGSFTITSGGDVRALFMVVFRKSTGAVGTVTRLGTSQQGSTGTAITPTTQTVTNSAGTAPLIVFAGYNGYGSRSFSPAGTSLSGNNKALTYRIDNTLTTDTTVSMTPGSFTEQIMVSFYLQVT